MNRLAFIWCLLLAMLSLLLVSCDNNEEPAVETDRSLFMLNIHLHEGSAATRSGEVFSDDYRPFEKAIRTLRVWVFARDVNGSLVEINVSDATNGVLYAKIDNVDASSGDKEVSFNVSNNFNEAYPELDIYAIANAESLSSIGADWGEPTGVDFTSTLEGLSLGQSDFGTSNLVADATSTGLPMSGYLKRAHVEIQGDNYITTDVKMKRAVSKIRFVFAKVPTMTSAAVTGINLTDSSPDGPSSLIPKKEWLFSGTAADNGEALHENGIDAAGGYEPEFSITPPSSIADNLIPSSLGWSGVDNSTAARQEWEKRLSDAIHGTPPFATEVGPFYLHESPLMLQGTISYTLDGLNIQTKAFGMSNEGDFLRNHSWTIFAYFSEGGLVFEVANWDNENVVYKPFI